MTKTVGHLKDAIKLKMAHALDAFDAPRLNLYRIDADASDEKKAIKGVITLAQDLGSVDSLNTTLELDELYPSGPPKKKIHILVKLPEGGSIHSKACDVIMADGVDAC